MSCVLKKNKDLLCFRRSNGHPLWGGDGILPRLQCLSWIQEKERYSLKEFLHTLPGGRHQNEVYSSEKNSYYCQTLYVQQMESTQGQILWVGTLLSICDSGASLLCVHDSTIERLKNPAKPLKWEVRKTTSTMFDALCVH